jgi:hypothetical protein
MVAQVDGADVAVTRQNGNFFTGTGIAFATPVGIFPACPDESSL